MAPRLPPIERAGYTLVEVVVAILLAAMMVTAVFSAALTGKLSGSLLDRRMAAAQGARRVASQLSAFVTADTAATLIPGPGAGSNRWSLDGGGLDDESCSNCYALAAGSHVVRGALPSWFESAPYNARVRYHVADVATPDGLVTPAVTITADWNEP